MLSNAGLSSHFYDPMQIMIVLSESEETTKLILFSNHLHMQASAK